MLKSDHYLQEMLSFLMLLAMVAVLLNIIYVYSRVSPMIQKSAVEVNSMDYIKYYEILGGTQITKDNKREVEKLIREVHSYGDPIYDENGVKLIPSQIDILIKRVEAGTVTTIQPVYDQVRTNVIRGVQFGI